MRVAAHNLPKLFLIHSHKAHRRFAIEAKRLHVLGNLLYFLFTLSQDVLKLGCLYHVKLRLGRYVEYILIIILSDHLQYLC